MEQAEHGTELDGLDLDEGPPRRHKELAQWLTQKNVKVEKRRAPDFGKWVAKLAKGDAPPKPGGLLPPPKDMVSRVIAVLGKPATDPESRARKCRSGATRL